MYKDFFPLVKVCLLSFLFITFPNFSFAEKDRIDYDLDDDGLIEINDLADLNEIRNHLDGKQLYGSSAGCPADSEGNAERGCVGFELTQDLDY